jgi:hypothetical protein
MIFANTKTARVGPDAICLWQMLRGKIRTYECPDPVGMPPDLSCPGRIRTYEWRRQRPLPYHLATGQGRLGANYFIFNVLRTF